MNYMKTSEIRESYLSFFESKGHLRMKSFSLVPKNDKSLLLINAGMAPLKPYFTGVEEPPRRRVTTCQKCIRTGDIENVGKTSRHGTFFEMLGNFSFGDYFKNEVIPWAWEYITEVLKLPKDKLFVTIYLDDDEAYDIWTSKTDIKPSQIFRLGKEDNFWEHGSGPCGPCTEIHYNKAGVKVNNVDEFVIASDNDEIIEFWNLVFTQFDGDGEGNYERLANPNIDTGMGLERMATIMQNVDNIFEIDIVRNILDGICKIVGKEYGKNDKDDVSLRIITDHVKSVSMMLCDGIQPSNEGRGYVLRRLLRRAARHGRVLGMKDEFLYKVVDLVVESYKEGYPELVEKADYIRKMITIEEKKFNETIDAGMDILKDYMDKAVSEGKTILDGKDAFKLYDTYGFPLELTEEIIEEKGLKVDMEQFNKAMQEQRERARGAREKTSYMGADEVPMNKVDASLSTVFDGYDKTELTSRVTVMATDEDFTKTLTAGQSGYVFTEVTPFYAEMGGQVGDTGMIITDNCKAEVTNCKKNVGGKITHFVTVTEGTLNEGESVKLIVDEKRRKDICKNHTATHMVQEALREVLGEHVHQSGSYVDEKGMRFDFTHFSALTEEEIKRVEEIVNSKIMDVYNVETKVMNIEEAKKTGAMALFDDKYSDDVRVVCVGDYSKELCGGTHVKNSGEIGLFKIISESGVAAGVRRIEALTGFGAMNFVNSKEKELKAISSSLRCAEGDIVKKIEQQLNELKMKDKEILELKNKIASGSENDILNNIKEVEGIKVLAARVDDVDGNALRDLCDKLRNKIGSGVVVLGGAAHGKVSFVSMATKDILSKGIHCGKIIKDVAAITGGGGGGRPDMAQAGGKDIAKLDEAVSKVDEIVKKLIK